MGWKKRHGDKERRFEQKRKAKKRSPLREIKIKMKEIGYANRESYY